MSEWYFAKEGKQEGPVSAEQINALVAQGALNPQADHVWREGLTDWVSIQASGVLTQTRASNIPAPTMRPVVQAATVANPMPVQARVATAAVNPYAAPITRAPAADYSAVLEYPGLGRLSYILWSLGIGVVANTITFVTAFASKSSSAGTTSGGMDSAGVLSIVVSLLFAIPSIIVAVKRLQNLGMSGWAFLFSLVPFLNIWISWRMTACPAGYGDHKQLDKAGKVITWIMLSLPILGIIIVAVAIAAQSR